jgi:hypothetical protein
LQKGSIWIALILRRYCPGCHGASALVWGGQYVLPLGERVATLFYRPGRGHALMRRTAVRDDADGYIPSVGAAGVFTLVIGGRQWNSLAQPLDEPSGRGICTFRSMRDRSTTWSVKSVCTESMTRVMRSPPKCRPSLRQSGTLLSFRFSFLRSPSAKTKNDII